MTRVARAVTVIPSTINPITRMPKAAVCKRRVAGYARVSTASDEQFTSYEAQIDYYTKYIQQRPDWQFVKVYTDEGISGTNTKKRDGFNEMIADALAGKIDLIVTKSVSRFARNTVDSLVTVRLLKEKGIEIYFEKENIYTLDSKGELLITLMSSLAQEESRSLSENVTWGQRKRFSDGKVNLPYKQFLGYRKGPDDLPEIVPEEATTVQRIYKLFIEGKTTTGIARILTREGVPTPAGKQNWRASTIESILRNEKYKGDALLQKAFTVDFLTKKQKKNEGEVPQYYVENSHPAIIAPNEWEAVQREFVRRKEIGRAYSGNTPLSTRLICDECGGYYGVKVWHSNDKYRKEIWQCNNKFKGNKNCTTPVVTEENVKERFMVVLGKMLNERNTVIENCRMIQKQLSDCTEIDEQIKTLLQEIEIVVEMTHRCISENASTAQNQAAYTEKYSGLVDRYEKLNSRLEQLQNQKKMRLDKAEDIGFFMFKTLEAETIITEFDDRLWMAAIDYVRVCTDGRLVFKFKAGLEIEG